MAHADYHCCAVCDNKLDYAGSDSRTKENVCSDCGPVVMDAVGKYPTVEALIEWIGQADAEDVAELGISKCYYQNPVDEAVERKADGGEPLFYDGRNFGKSLVNLIHSDETAKES